jgi:hypothetical protein
MWRLAWLPYRYARRTLGEFHAGYQNKALEDYWKRSSASEMTGW